MSQRPDWDMACLAPISEAAVVRLWNHHGMKRLTPHRLQELLSELVELMLDPAVNPGQHVDSWASVPAGPCVSEHIKAARRSFLEEVPTHRPEERAEHLLPEHLQW